MREEIESSTPLPVNERLEQWVFGSEAVVFGGLAVEGARELAEGATADPVTIGAVAFFGVVGLGAGRIAHRAFRRTRAFNRADEAERNAPEARAAQITHYQDRSALAGLSVFGFAGIGASEVAWIVEKGASTVGGILLAATVAGGAVGSRAYRQSRLKARLLAGAE